MMTQNETNQDRVEAGVPLISSVHTGNLYYSPHL